MKQIVADADAPFGSLYHFFPAGKEELGAEVVRMSGDFFQELFLAVARSAPGPVAAVEAFFAGAAQTLRDTDYADACPIATVALETANANERMREATAEVFGKWLDGIAQYFMANGLSRRKARHMSLTMIVALEGAFVLSRPMRTTEPLDVACRQVVAELRRNLSGRG